MVYFGLADLSVVNRKVVRYHIGQRQNTSETRPIIDSIDCSAKALDPLICF